MFPRMRTYLSLSLAGSALISCPSSRPEKAETGETGTMGEGHGATYRKTSEGAAAAAAVVVSAVTFAKSLDSKEISSFPKEEVISSGFPLSLFSAPKELRILKRDWRPAPPAVMSSAPALIASMLLTSNPLLPAILGPPEFDTLQSICEEAVFELVFLSNVLTSGSFGTVFALGLSPRSSFASIE